jgi:hypothetical protein
MNETREEVLLRTSEVYRRLRAPVAAERERPALELSRDAPPPDMARALPQQVGDDPGAPALIPPPAELPREPGFVWRMLTRKPDLREIALLTAVALVLWFAQG